ncbi:MAG: TIM barrel protein [Chloroflexi bacterium]|nr:TIM barrel protein [Chloroflexota bacterium]
MARPKFRIGTVGTPRSAPKKPGGAVGAVMWLRELGLEAFEIGWVRSVRVKEETCALIKEAGADHDVALSVHAPYFINLNADDDEWPKSRKRLMDAAHYGNLAGATDIIFHPGSYFGRAPEEVLEKAIPRLQGCVDELRAADNPATLRPETMGKGALLGSLQDALEMSREIEGVEPCVDFSHLHARAGDGTRNSYDEWTEVIKRYKKALGARALKRMHIHLAGIEYGPKGEQNHLMLAESDFDLGGLLRALHDEGCGGRIMCESPIMEDDALVIQERWLKLNAT